MKHSQMYDELTGKIKGIYVMLVLAILLGVWTYMTGAIIITFALALICVFGLILLRNAHKTRNQVKE